MSNGRKTTEVIHLVVTLNRAIVNARSIDERKGLCLAIEEVLHGSGNYAGFGYLESINWDTADDATRDRVTYARVYYLNETLHAEYRKHYQWCRTCDSARRKSQFGDICPWCGSKVDQKG